MRTLVEEINLIVIDDHVSSASSAVRRPQAIGCRRERELNKAVLGDWVRWAHVRRHARDGVDNRRRQEPVAEQLSRHWPAWRTRRWRRRRRRSRTGGDGRCW